MTALQIKCDGCTLSADWLPDVFVPEILRQRGENVRILRVCGHDTPSGNIKYLPAWKAIDWLIASGQTGPGKKALVPSSGNFLSSVDQVVKDRGVEVELIGIVSSKLPSGKRRDLESRDISLITELDLAAKLGLSKPDDTFEMLREYSRMTGIPVLDQYDCDWNRPSYMPIAEEIMLHTKVSLFVSTAGTKGKYGIGVKLRERNPNMPLVVAFPYPGQGFPGGRGYEDILKVRNEFGIEPIRRSTDEIVPYYWAPQLCAEGYPDGITLAAELVTAQHYLLEMLRDNRLDELRLADGSIVVVLVCSDMIYPYIEEGMRYFPHLYSKIVRP